MGAATAQAAAWAAVALVALASAGAEAWALETGRFQDVRAEKKAVLEALEIEAVRARLGPDARKQLHGKPVGGAAAAKRMAERLEKLDAAAAKEHAAFERVAAAWLERFGDDGGVLGVPRERVAPLAAGVRAACAGAAFHMSGGSLLAPMLLHAAGALSDAAHVPTDGAEHAEVEFIAPAAEAAEATA